MNFKNLVIIALFIITFGTFAFGEAPVANDGPAGEPPALTPPAVENPTPEEAPVSTPASSAAPPAAATSESKSAETAAVAEKADAKESQAAVAERKTGIARLLKKLITADGKQVPVAILTPLDYTTLNYADLARETIFAAITRYGNFDLRRIAYSPASLTLEEFRKICVHYKLDIVILAVLKPTNFDMFLYDRRTPYQIYAHSEVLPEAVQYQLSKQIVEEYVKVIVRRTLYAYMQDQFFELPREEGKQVLNSEIPRYLASNRSLATVNRELLSSFYASGGVGASLSGGEDKLWTSNLVSLQLGLKIFDPVYLEAGVDLSAYNAALASFKYMVTSKDSAFRFLFGLGIASSMNAHTLNWDQNYSQGGGGKYLVGSAAFTFPIVDIHFKVESHLYVGGGRYILAMTPGIFVLF